MEKKTKKEIDWDERWFEVFKAAITGAMAEKSSSHPKFIVQKACGVASHAISVLREIEENKSKQE